MKKTVIVIYSMISILLPGSLPLFTGVGHAADIAVIVNKNNCVKQLTLREVSNIYLGRTRAFSSGKMVWVLEREKNSQLRADFYRLLNKMTLNRLNAYWARLQFSGHVQPPAVISDTDDLLKQVRKNPEAIGYIHADNMDTRDNSIHIVLRLKDQ